MGMPTVTVEAAFTTDPGATPTWTDISAYLKRLTVHRGRADELSAFSAGQAQITLTNEDRRFDPNYSSSPYSPNVIPMRRIRIRATWNAITYDVFNGYVTNWRQTYSPPADAECVVEATDAFKVLSNIVLPASTWAAEIRADSPAIWWRLDDAAGSTTILDAIGTRHATVIGAPTLGAAGLVTGDPGTAMLTSASTQGASTARIPSGLTPSFPITLAAIVKTTSTAAGVILELVDDLNNNVLTLSTDGFTAVIGARNAAATQAGSTGLVSIVDGNPHLVVGVWDGAGGLKVYVDGAATGTPGSLTGPIFTPTQVWLGGGQAQSGGTSVGFIGTIDEAAVFLSAPSAARIAAWHSARSAPWKGDLTGARVGRLLDAAGWPAADRNIDTGTSTLQNASLGVAALAALQAVEQTEFGALFVTAAGLVRFISRTSLLSAPYTTSQGTFGDSGSELEFADLSFEYDDKLIYNEAQVSRSGGAVQTVGDTASQTKYLRRSKVVSGLLHQSDQTSLDAANWIVQHYKDPLLRVTGMRLEPSAGNESTHFPHVLGRELMDRVTINRRPQNLGAAITQDSLIQGITHTVTATEWVTRWDLSPAETQVYWLAGVAGNSEAGQTTRAGF